MQESYSNVIQRLFIFRKSQYMHAIVLGSGLSTFSDGFTIREEVNYSSITQNKTAKLEGHTRTLYLAEHQGIPFLILSGKFHYYEGLSNKDLVAPYLYILHNFQIDTITITATSGALVSSCNPGKWYRVKKVLSLQPASSLAISNNHFSKLEETVYAYQPGPSLGTRAEYHMLEKLGAGLVGMSVLPEGQFLQKKQIQIIGLSLPVCQYAPIELCTEPGHEEVVRNAQSGVQELILIFREFLMQNT